MGVGSPTVVAEAMNAGICVDLPGREREAVDDGLHQGASGRS